MITFSRAHIMPRVGVLVAASALLLAGCAESSSGGSGANGGGEGVAFGATMEEYKAAFADVDPIVLYTQSPSTQGSTGGAFIDAYTSAVEEWSDGKITFDIAYSDAIAKSTEIDNAVVDGRSTSDRSSLCTSRRSSRPPPLCSTPACCRTRVQSPESSSRMPGPRTLR